MFLDKSVKGFFTATNSQFLYITIFTIFLRPPKVLRVGMVAVKNVNPAYSQTPVQSTVAHRIRFEYSS